MLYNNFSAPSCRREASRKAQKLNLKCSELLSAEFHIEGPIKTQLRTPAYVKPKPGLDSYSKTVDVKIHLNFVVQYLSGKLQRILFSAQMTSQNVSMLFEYQTENYSITLVIQYGAFCKSRYTHHDQEKFQAFRDLRFESSFYRMCSLFNLSTLKTL